MFRRRDDSIHRETKMTDPAKQDSGVTAMWRLPSQGGRRGRFRESSRKALADAALARARLGHPTSHLPRSRERWGPVLRRVSELARSRQSRERASASGGRGDLGADGDAVRKSRRPSADGVPGCRENRYPPKALSASWRISTSCCARSHTKHDGTFWLFCACARDR